MVNRLSPCNPDRLRSYLDDALSSDEQADLAGHLDRCGTCQKALERLAAGSGLWRDLRHLGGSSDASMMGPIAENRTGGPRGRSKPAAGREGLEFLAPSDDPAYLGRVGLYQVIGVLGEGGMGMVLKAFDPSLSRVVAIKVLAPQMAASGAARRRFSREAKAAAAVVHEHVISIYAVDNDPVSSLPYLVMPCIAGPSLQERIDRDGPLRIEEVLRIGRQTALGLAAAHAQGLVHRDIKPSNILLENGVERVKITDFGLARAMDDASQSQSGLLAGTPQYMSPEQARGEASDHRSDLFSLGSVLYAMCAGHSPFRAKTTMGVLRRVCDESPRPLVEINPEVPEELESVIERLHAKDPAGRYQTAAEVAEVLGQQLAQLQRPGARATRRTTAARPQPVAAKLPPARKALPIDDWAPVRPHLRVERFVVPALLILFCLGVVGATIGWEATPLAASLLLLLGVTAAGTAAHLGRQGIRSLGWHSIALLLLLGLVAVGTSAWFTPLGPVAPQAVLAAGFADPPGAGQQTSRDRSGPAEIVPSPAESDRPTIVGSGTPATKAWNLADFTSVEIIHPFRAEVSRADRFAVSVTADDNVLDHIQVVKEGTRLRIGLESNRTYRLRRDSLKVAIAMPALDSLDLSHGARASINRFESHRLFEARASHGSLLEGTMVAGRLLIQATHGSEVGLKGTAETARLVAAHGSELPLDGLAFRDAEIQLSHGSTATIDAKPDNSLKVGLHHGSTMSGGIQGGTLNLEAGHGCVASLKGSARMARLAGTFSSRFPLGGLTVETAEVHLGHGSSATVHATNTLDYSLEFSSSLKYLGNPTIGTSSKSHGSSAQMIRSDDAEAKNAGEAGQVQRRPTRTGRAEQRGDEIITIDLRSWGDGDRTIQIHTNQSGDPAGVIVGSGQQATRPVDVKDFTAIKVEHSLRAEVTRGDAFQVRMTADDNILDRIEAVREGSTLRIGLARGNYRLQARPVVSISLPILEGIELSGASRATIQGFASDRPFHLHTSGASQLEGSIRAGDVDFDISGASKLKLEGSARGARILASGASKLDLAGWQVNGEKLIIDVSGATSARLSGSARAATLKAEGASQLQLADLALEAADVVVGGASTVTVRVKSLLNYDVSSVSTLVYHGEPTIGQAKKTGRSSVSHRP
jgi:serine/threonine-protein kinase